MQGQYLTNLRNSLGIAMMWVLPPFLYFLKQFIGNSNGFVTTALFYTIGLLLMFNRRTLRIAYKPNWILTFFGASFFCISILYFFLYNSDMSSFILEFINLFLVLVFFLLLLRIDNKVQDHLIGIIFLASLMINILLIYSIATNPEFTIGMRATVQYKSKTNSDFSGNPYVYSKNGFIGFIISYLLINKGTYFNENSFKRVFCHINLWLSIIVIIITQTRATILALALTFIPIFLIITPIKKNLFKFKKISFVFYGIIFFVLRYIDAKFNVINTMVNYYNNYSNLIQKAILTGAKLGKVSDKDDSAMGRVRNIEFFFRQFEFYPHNFIFGNGYRFRYMDIPFLEVFMNFGILGILLFITIHILIFYYSIRSFYSNHIFQNFIALLYLHTFVSSFTTGRPTDFPYWIFLFILFRFLNVEASQKPMDVIKTL